MSTISSIEYPRWPFSGPGVASDRSINCRVIGGGCTKLANRRRTCAVSRGNKTEATSGIEVSTPRMAVAAPPTTERLTVCSQCQKRPITRRVSVRRRCDWANE